MPVGVVDSSTMPWRVLLGDVSADLLVLGGPLHEGWAVIDSARQCFMHHGCRHNHCPALLVTCIASSV